MHGSASESRPRLEDGELLWQPFADASPVGFMLCDAELRILYANTTILENLKVIRLSDLTGTSLQQIAPNAAPEGRIEAYNRVIVTGEPITIDDAMRNSKHCLRRHPWESGLRMHGNESFTIIRHFLR
ncbi:MAG: PAS domain-containing protein [Candidatus Eisenbacteria bacterium]|uniref:PAS domain-containing protein n=1 Tax=Eiseniibacteriota bacterium TaxID=2212470 RepID=A0A948S0P1_UNCEI|nr:PAS domain-containing protein [Candidatus Eisenbacteria bacterium]MBU1949651.1 PAS domain-containing protein [Candidatus Eisenbacteria bacterium]MBU2693044.1 PAS domain-containing protein [Candidatus Eisenbacteria bacterium]